MKYILTILIVIGLFGLCGEVKADMITWITPTEVSPGSANGWIDVDVSGNVAVGTTGVILHLINKGANDGDDMGIRKNGSTDARNADINNDSHYWAMIGVDGSYIFEAYIGDTTDIDIFLVGYTDSGATFFTNGINYEPAAGSWTDKDATSDTSADTVGLIFETYTSQRDYGVGYRKNGSTDTWGDTDGSWRKFWAIIGCDDDEIVEIFVENAANSTVFLVGYIENGATFLTNATQIAESVTWADIAALPEGATGAFIEVENTNATYNHYGLRKNGSAEDIVRRARQHCWGIIEADEDRIIENEISNTSYGPFMQLVGYSTAAVAEERRIFIID